jgi:hypothetical protein
MAADPNPQFMATFMPWAHLGREITIGPVSVWPHRALAAKKIKDKAVRAHLRRLIRRYVEVNGKQTKGPAVVTHGETDFRILTDEEWADVRVACDALIFSIVYPNLLGAVVWRNQGGPPSADRYKLYTQHFQPGKDWLAVIAGSRRAFWGINDITFQSPYCLGGFDSRPQERLIEGMANLFSPRFDPERKRRIIMALEWFRLARSEVDEITPFNKVVMMATAFEILLQLPSGKEKASAMRKRINPILAHKDSILEKRTLKDRIGNDYEVEVIKAAWWASDFYSLRNAIAHGDDVTIPQLMFNKHISHLHVATLVFGELLVWELESFEFSDDVRKNMESFRTLKGPDFVGPLEPESWSYSVRQVHHLVDAHRKLGWASDPLKGKVGFELPTEEDEDDED